MPPRGPSRPVGSPWAPLRGQAALALLALSLGARLLVGSPPVLHDWDERYHALVAKHLAARPLEPSLVPGGAGAPGEGWTTTSIFLHKPPLALWTMAAGLRLLGRSEWALRAGSALLGTAAVALTLSLGAELFSETAALLAALSVAIAPELLWLTSGGKATDQVDAQLVFWVTLSAFALWRVARRPGPGAVVLAAVALGGGLLTKSWPALAALPAALTVCRGRRPASAIGLAALGGVAAAEPWKLYAAARWPLAAAAERAYALRHFVEPLEGHAGGAGFYAVEAFRWLGPAAWLAPLAALPALWRPDREGERFLLLWILVPLAVFGGAATKMNGYLAPEIPALALLAAGVASRWRGAERSARRLAASALLASVALWPLAASALALPRMLAVPAGYAAFRARASSLARGDVVFNLRWAPQAMFYSDARASEDWPTPEGIARLRAAGLRPLLARCPETPRPASAPMAAIADLPLPAGCAR